MQRSERAAAVGAEEMNEWMDVVCGGTPRRRPNKHQFDGQTAFGKGSLPISPSLALVGGGPINCVVNVPRMELALDPAESTAFDLRWGQS